MSVLKEATKLDDTYKAISLDLFDMQDDEERIIDEVKFQLDTLKYSRGLTDEQLEEEGYTDGQIQRMKNTAIKHLEAFLNKYS
ncbi:hypothetical protein [Oceanobacillus timonensis]|uniref:hypothetical protein n=1 Tax=Oceanobacillus timonensis TaxID=1926285 RepID=UPI0009BA2CCB|nr:hypothetical protein [Oceanobacillus timonensis]